MVTWEEAVNALKCCIDPPGEYKCCSCPFYEIDNCKQALLIVSLEWIEKLQKENIQLEKKAKAYEQEYWLLRATFAEYVDEMENEE